MKDYTLPIDFTLPILSTCIVFGCNLIIGMVLYGFFWLASILAQSLVNKLTKRLIAEKQAIALLLSNLVKISIHVLGLITALGSMGVNVSALVAGLGLSGFALSFALKDALSNVLAGLMILIYQPFRINQYIEIKGLSGRVKKIDLRYTTLENNEKKILVPNASILIEPVIVSNMPLPAPQSTD